MIKPLIAVVDVETTGLNPYRHDRVVEVAAVAMSADGHVARQFVSLVNPERDIGPTSIHGLSASHVHLAPRFGDIASALVECLDGCVAVAGHNVQFDLAFLSHEFARLGYALESPPSLCTMRLAGGGKLETCCEDYGIPMDGRAHSALTDAMASAQLLTVLLADAPELLGELKGRVPIRWPGVPRRPCQAVTRADSVKRQSGQPEYVQRLLERTRNTVPRDLDDASVAAYTALLDVALEDRRIEEGEADALVELAECWGLSRAQVTSIHERYVEDLVVVARADGVVTAAEGRDLEKVAGLLGIPLSWLAEKLNSAPSESVRQESTDGSDAGALAGRRVCFTGECQCQREGVPLSRAAAHELARQKGLIVAESVTKKLDLLVVADPYTVSGKAKKARQYGIRVLHEPVFWKMIGVTVE